MILNDIIRYKKEYIEAMPDIGSPALCTTDFSAIFRNPPAIIAEIKAASPSEGDIVKGEFHPVSIARDYEFGGADAISVLTDEKFFKGSYDVLRSVRNQTFLPLLCKDFIISPKQVHMARYCGADLCLLIVKILEPRILHDLRVSIEDLGMMPLIEVQTEQEMQVALAAEAKMILINSRNLENFSMDYGTTTRLIDMIPDNIKIIAASGINNPVDLQHYPARTDGFLIGTALMRANDKIAFLRGCRAQQN